MPDEVEGKLVLTSRDRAAVIEAIAKLDAIGIYTVVDRSEHSLSDAYFDTPARDLAAARLALRVRSEDGRDRLTLKAEGSADQGVVSRYELERDWSREALKEVLRVVAGRGVALDVSTPDLTGGAAASLESLGLRQSSPRTNRRTALALAAATGAIVAELDVDRVTFAAGEFAVRHYEVECEAHGDSGADVIRAVLVDLGTHFAGMHAVDYSKLDLAEHLVHLAMEDRLAALLDGGMLTAAAYEEIERVIVRGA